MSQPPNPPYGDPSSNQPYGAPPAPPAGGGYGPPGGYGAPGGYGMPGASGPYYISLQGTEQGPLDVSQLSQMAAAGQIKGETQLRSAEGQQWFPASQVPGLFSDKEWLTTLLISLFVGGLGVDRFFLGYTGLGVAKLLTCGGCGIWSIIDFILIAMRKVPDAQGRPLA